MQIRAIDENLVSFRELVTCGGINPPLLSEVRRHVFIRGRTRYDPAMAKLTPGAVRLGWRITQVIAEGIREVDFLRKTEAYKYLGGIY